MKIVRYLDGAGKIGHASEQADGIALAIPGDIFANFQVTREKADQEAARAAGAHDDLVHRTQLQISRPGDELQNDGRADPRGSLWVGSMRNNVKADRSPGEAGGRDGIPYRIDPDGRITIHRRNVGISSTLAWSPDGRRFYFGDSLASVIWAYDYVPQTGDVSNESPFLENFSRGLPDGSTVD